MSTTITIPSTNLTTNQVVTAGPAAVTAGQFSAYSFSLSRTQTPTAIDTLSGLVFTMEVDQSSDGGTTYPVVDEDTINGGVVNNKGGTEITTSTFGSSIGPTVNEMRARVTASQAFSTSGTLTLS